MSFSELRFKFQLSVNAKQFRITLNNKSEAPTPISEVALFLIFSMTNIEIINIQVPICMDKYLLGFIAGPIA